MARIYTITTLPGLWPVGTAAVVVANDKAHAERLIRADWPVGLDEDAEIRVGLQEIDPNTAGLTILNDGDY